MEPKENKDFSSDEHVPEYEKMIVDFVLGIRGPQNVKEQRVFDEIKEIEAKGHIVEIPKQII